MLENQFVLVFQPQMLVLTVTGMFKELRSGHKVPPIRFFYRTLVIVPAGSGFCIANEELHITNATDDQSAVSYFLICKFSLHFKDSYFIEKLNSFSLKSYHIYYY